MSANTDNHYIDLSADKCIAIQSRHILIKRKSDGAYCQGRPINAIEEILTNEIVSLRADLQAAQQRNAALEAAVNEARQYTRVAQNTTAHLILCVVLGSPPIPRPRQMTMTTISRHC